MEYERRFKFLVCAPSFNTADLDWQRLQQIVDETQRLGFTVQVARNTEDAELAIQTDAAIGCMVVDWGKRGMLSKPAGLISLVRKRGLEMPVLILLRRKRLEDIPVEVLNQVDGTIFLSEETPEFIARNLVSRLRVLLIDDGAGHVHEIGDELARQGHEVVGVLDSALLVHDCVQRLQPDVVIVDSESPTRDTLENLATLSAKAPRPVVVFTEDAAAEPMQRALRAGVSAYVVAGLLPERLAPVLQVAIARFEHEAALRGQLAKAEQQLANRKIVERAKGILMAEAGFDEQAAYNRLRRLAMDRGKRLADMAQSVIDAQELLRSRD